MSVLFAAERHLSGVCIATGDEQGELCQRAVQILRPSSQGPGWDLPN